MARTSHTLILVESASERSLVQQSFRPSPSQVLAKLMTYQHDDDGDNDEGDSSEAD